MKQQADQHRSERIFDVGYWVFLRLRRIINYCQSNMVLTRFCKRLVHMAYKLELPASSRVHLVFHVSCLKKVIGDKLPIQKSLPKLDKEGKTILEPKAVTETRTQQLRNRSISEYLIKWKNLPTENFTWEDENFMQKHPELLKH